jgi:2-O-methyltransferase
MSFAHTGLDIHTWLQLRFHGPEPKLILELGANHGQDTLRLLQLPNVTVHAFEPDPRNHILPAPNLILNRAAIAAHDGPTAFYLSTLATSPDQDNPWTESSSIRRPKTHLLIWPHITFPEHIEVPAITLDTYYTQQHLDVIDFIWADVQGAEGDLIDGGPLALAHTRYLYTECYDNELYEGQITRADILHRLPDWQIIETYPNDLLLENQALLNHPHHPDTP